MTYSSSLEDYQGSQEPKELTEEEKKLIDQEEYTYIDFEEETK